MVSFFSELWLERYDCTSKLCCGSCHSKSDNLLLFLFGLLDFWKHRFSGRWSCPWQRRAACTYWCLYCFFAWTSEYTVSKSTRVFFSLTAFHFLIFQEFKFYLIFFLVFETQYLLLTQCSVSFYLSFELKMWYLLCIGDHLKYVQCVTPNVMLAECSCIFL